MIHTKPLREELELSRELPAQEFAREEADLEGRQIPVEPSDEDKKALAFILAEEETKRKKNTRRNEKVQARIRGFQIMRERREDYTAATKPTDSENLQSSEATHYNPSLFDKLKSEIRQSQETAQSSS